MKPKQCDHCKKLTKKLAPFLLQMMKVEDPSASRLHFVPDEYNVEELFYCEECFKKITGN